MRPRTCVVVLLVVTLGGLVGAGPAGAVVRKVFYGRPGRISLPVVQGYHALNEQPLIHFAQRNIFRAPGAPRSTQRICSTHQVLAQRGPPYYGWAVVARFPSCSWLRPGYEFTRNAFNWQAGFGTGYHVVVVVTWRTRTRKLAKASWDYNNAADYQCLTDGCEAGVDSTNVAYIGFTV
jgi:hypothetical protein